MRLGCSLNSKVANVAIATVNYWITNDLISGENSNPQIKRKKDQKEKEKIKIKKKRRE